MVQKTKKGIPKPENSIYGALIQDFLQLKLDVSKQEEKKDTKEKRNPIRIEGDAVKEEEKGIVAEENLAEENLAE